MAINEIFREMFSEQKRERELKFQQEIIRKTLEDQGYNINDFDTGLELLDNEDYENLLYIRILGFEEKEEVGNSFFTDKSKKFYLVK